MQELESRCLSLVGKEAHTEVSQCLVGHLVFRGQADCKSDYEDIQLDISLKSSTE